MNLTVLPSSMEGSARISHGSIASYIKLVKEKKEERIQKAEAANPYEVDMRK